MSARSLLDLKRFARTKRERCELCGATVGPAHQHLIEPKSRDVLCACDACALVFDAEGRTRFKRIPRDPRELPGLALTDADWRELLPVQLAFVYRSSHAGKPVAVYPGPMGATESVVEPEAWVRLSSCHERIAGLAEDVEALLVSRLRSGSACLIAPIDRCFELVGILRTRWQGINGGDEVWPEVSAFLGKLKEAAI